MEVENIEFVAGCVVRTKYADYDPQLSHDGGSYYQPTITVLMPDGMTAEIVDSSCGDFGDRILVTLRYGAEELGWASYGSMVGSPKSTLSPDYLGNLAILRDATGYFVPIAGEEKEGRAGRSVAYVDYDIGRNAWWYTT